MADTLTMESLGLTRRTITPLKRAGIEEARTFVDQPWGALESGGLESRLTKTPGVGVTLRSEHRTAHDRYRHLECDASPVLDNA